MRAEWRVEENASGRGLRIVLRHGQLSTDANLEIIGKCGSSNVRGSFLPVQAIRLPSQGEQPLGNSVEAAAHR
ncbi:jg10037 [Pararge aegeria aegeria]|uniref:Jg10037 protein n=1 Tax=Pararge aegeria aegeria TaxID=348720 RepID=A0A8S4SCI8_9NEOP|nr:jg10037 [Pararge aegeria aegeria]